MPLANTWRAGTNTPAELSAEENPFGETAIEKNLLSQDEGQEILRDRREFDPDTGSWGKCVLNAALTPPPSDQMNGVTPGTAIGAASMSPHS